MALVDRSPRGSRLTDAGALVTDWARRIVEAAEAFDAGAQALRGRRDSRLRVAASMTIAEYLLPGWLIALRAERPDTAVSLQAGNSAAVAERLFAGDADVGFVEGLAVPDGLDGVVVARDRLAVVAAPRTRGLAAAPRWTRRSWPRPRWCCGSAARAPGRSRRGARRPRGLARPLLELASTTAVKAAAVSGRARPSSANSRSPRSWPPAAWSPSRSKGALRRDLRAVWPAGHRPTGPARDLLS